MIPVATLVALLYGFVDGRIRGLEIVQNETGFLRIVKKNSESFRTYDMVKMCSRKRVKALENYGFLLLSVLSCSSTLIKSADTKCVTKL